MPVTFTVEDFRRELDDIWGKFDALYADLDASTWDRTFGKDWKFLDQPYHLHEIDEMVVRNISIGEDLPEQESIIIDDESKMNSWNTDLLAKRSASQTGPESLEDWKQTRDAMRGIMGNLADSDLSRRAFMPLYVGWSDVRFLLGFSLVHAVGEYTELAMRLKKNRVLPTPAAINYSFDLLMNLMPIVMNKEAADGVSLKSVMTFTGEGGGSWTIDVADGQCTVSDGRDENRDLEIKTSFLGFLKMSRKMSNPIWMMLTRQVRISGMRKMGTFGKLFPN